MAKASSIEIPLILREDSVSDAQAFLASVALGLNHQQQSDILAYFLHETREYMATLSQAKLTIPSEPWIPKLPGGKPFAPYTVLEPGVPILPECVPWKQVEISDADSEFLESKELDKPPHGNSTEGRGLKERFRRDAG